MHGRLASSRAFRSMHLPREMLSDLSMLSQEAHSWGTAGLISGLVLQATGGGGAEVPHASCEHPISSGVACREAGTSHRVPCRALSVPQTGVLCPEKPPASSSGVEPRQECVCPLWQASDRAQISWGCAGCRGK